MYGRRTPLALHTPHLRYVLLLAFLGGVAGCRASSAADAEPRQDAQALRVVDPGGGGTPTLPVLPPAVETRPSTALLALTLKPDGRVESGGLVPKAIDWRGPASAVSSRLLADAAAPESGEALPAPPEAARYVLVAEHEQRPEPVAVPLDLGYPGEGGGDVLDRWQHESLLLRVPTWGPGTRLRLLRLHPAGDRLLFDSLLGAEVVR